MSVMKVFFVLLITAILMPVLGVSGAQNPPQDISSPSAVTSPYLGNDIVISQLDNKQVSPSYRPSRLRVSIPLAHLQGD